MATCYMCPYFKHRSHGRIYCEGATVKAPDVSALAEFTRDYCASEQGYKSCAHYNMMNKYYDKIYEGGEGRC